MSEVTKSIDDMIQNAQNKKDMFHMSFSELCVSAEKYLETLPLAIRDIYHLTNYLNELIPKEELSKKGISFEFYRDGNDRYDKTVAAEITLKEPHPLYHELLFHKIYISNGVVMEAKRKTDTYTPGGGKYFSAVKPCFESLKNKTVMDWIEEQISDMQKKVELIQQSAGNISDFMDGKPVKEIYSHLKTDMEIPFEMEKDLNVLRKFVRYSDYAIKHNLDYTDKGLYQKEILGEIINIQTKTLDKQAAKQNQEPVL